MTDKTVTGMLNGLAKRRYYNESEITDDFLKEQLFPDLTNDEFENHLQKYNSLLNNLVFSDMETKQVEAYLSSQMKRKPDFLTENEAAAVMKFWKLNKQKIHDVIFQETSWNNKLKSIKWRIDVNYESSNVTNAPKVIFELDVSKTTSVNKSNDDKILFEVDNNRLCDLITQIENIESKINDITK